MASLPASVLFGVTLICLGFTTFLYFLRSDVLRAPQSSNKDKSNGRSVVFWLDPSTSGNNGTDWERRIAEVAAHRENLTGIIPCIHAIQSDGQLGANDMQFKSFMPYIDRYKAMGLEIFAFLGDTDGLPGVLAAMKRGSAFFDQAVKIALANGYDGYNWDIEVHGNQDEASWNQFKKYSSAYMQFLNSFADALHAHGLSLSVDIGGCCGWKDEKNPESPAGHCGGAWATNEFMATTCMQYNQSRIDRVYSMSTYTGAFNGPDVFVMDLKAVASSAAAGVGIAKYGIGVKHEFRNNASSFDAEARASIDWLHGLGVQHLAKFMNEPTTQAQWDAWGYFLHH
eukprot:gnl/MRDRNA2_/MRDRNA2_69854_c0_seq1.p1 gnl/MRDRNA2_/MRDRNA2_69854_c0~~gnl/MRDRNA2_/MRDRNA2_69854_c0_seq1.p1  ORF type:complete len:362 (-),score=61.27 gnl/MRDRNA2_/MRDRNA2_69854_c0_seq1:99-1118(-)